MQLASSSFQVSFNRRSQKISIFAYLLTIFVSSSPSKIQYHPVFCSTMIYSRPSTNPCIYCVLSYFNLQPVFSLHCNTHSVHQHRRLNFIQTQHRVFMMNCFKTYLFCMYNLVNLQQQVLSCPKLFSYSQPVPALCILSPRIQNFQFQYYKPETQNLRTQNTEPIFTSSKNLLYQKLTQTCLYKSSPYTA
jgi:hypothetical protein